MFGFIPNHSPLACKNKDMATKPPLATTERFPGGAEWSQGPFTPSHRELRASAVKAVLVAPASTAEARRRFSCNEIPAPNRRMPGRGRCLWQQFHHIRSHSRSSALPMSHEPAPRQETALGLAARPRHSAQRTAGRTGASDRHPGTCILPMDAPSRHRTTPVRRRNPPG